MFWTIGLGAPIAGAAIASIGAPRESLTEVSAAHA
jgi:hypothetical protein